MSSTDKNLDINMVITPLVQARAVSRMLIGEGKDVKEGFSLNHEDVMNGIWAVETLIDQAIQAAGNPS